MILTIIVPVCAGWRGRAEVCEGGAQVQLLLAGLGPGAGGGGGADLPQGGLQRDAAAGQLQPRPGLHTLSISHKS